MEPLILTFDAGYRPNCWVTHRDAIVYHAKGQVLEWSPGEKKFTYTGGKSRLTGELSSITTSSIIAIDGPLMEKHAKRFTNPVKLTNLTLFTRDKHVCAYCGNHFDYRQLTRDHVIPKRAKGQDIWTNVVTACKRCNNKKGDRILRTGGDMQLLYVPYTPCKAEYLILENRKIIADQMEFLKSQVKNKDSRIFS